MPSLPLRLESFVVCSVLAVFANACQRRTQEPESRPAPSPSSEPPPAAFLAPPHEHAGEQAADDRKVTWSDPPGWTRLPQSSPMRLATYRVPHAASDKDDGELAVFHFGGGQGGDVEANLKRWEGQFADTKKGDAKRTDRTVNGLKAHVLEIDRGTYTAMAMMPGQTSSPKNDYAMLASVVETPVGPFFFKLTGPSKTIQGQKDAYMTLLDSVKVAD
jgi:hypothetical protein